ncbi:MAG: glutamate-1-semialdehyde 2,1-aminomutase [Waddliaceae bacterium]
MTVKLQERKTNQKSADAYQKLCEVIPGGVNSPVRSFPNLKRVPMIVESGRGDCIVDVDGNERTDYCCSWGALIHGHAHEQILGPVRERMSKGTTFGASTLTEERLARKIVQHAPSVESIRFTSSGTEATMSAVRLARGYTGKELIVKFSGNYHGSADCFLVQAGSGVSRLSSTASSKGIPASVTLETVSLPYNDSDACDDFFRKRGSEVAAVIVEPVAGNMGVVPGKADFLSLLREATQRYGCVLIFDEVISGFRLGLNGAQGLYGIEPDLSCFGKIIGGGFPVGAFGGKAAIMEQLAPLGPVYQAGTLSGNPVAMEAGLQALLLLEEEGVYQTLQEKTETITKPVQDALIQNNIPACVQQAGSMFTIFWGKRAVDNRDDAVNLDADRFEDFFTFMYERGVYFPPSQQEACFVSTAHTQSHLERTRKMILEYIEGIS